MSEELIKQHEEMLKEYRESKTINGHLHDYLMSRLEYAWLVDDESNNLRAQLAATQKELESLKQWKVEQPAVESTWDIQTVGKEIEVGRGKNIRECILPYIQKMKKELEQARQELHLIDEALSRRLALDDCKIRLDKVYKACSVAGRAEQAERERDESRKWAEAQAKLINKLEAENAGLKARLKPIEEVFNRDIGFNPIAYWEAICKANKRKED